MHELSIALSIVEMAEEEAARLGAVRVNAIHLRLGPLSGVVKEALLSSYGLACDGTSLEGSRLLIAEIPILVYCGTCQAQRNPPAPQWLCCPVCSGPTPQILQGKELEVVALEIEQ
jgi:hydrogenase nickel incorporation protein HypA/HybF